MSGGEKTNQHHTQDSIKNCHYLQLVGSSRVPSDKITHTDCSNTPLWEHAVAQHWEYAWMDGGSPRVFYKKPQQGTLKVSETCPETYPPIFLNSICNCFSLSIEKSLFPDLCSIFRPLLHQKYGKT